MDGVAEAPERSPTFQVLTTSTLQVILASSFIGVIGIPLISPTLPAIRSVFGITDVQVGLMITVYTLPIIFLAPIIGALADRIGRKLILVVALVCYGTFGTAIAVTTVYPMVLVLRFLQGAAASGLITMSLILIADNFNGAQRNAAMGMNGAVISVGASVAPVVGGTLAEVSWNAPFVVYSVALIIAVYAYLTLKTTDSRAASIDISYLKDAVASLTSIEAVTLYGTVFAMFLLLFGAVYTIFPLLLDSNYGIDTRTIGLIITASPAVSAIVASGNGFLARYFTTNQLVIVGMVLLGLSMLGVGLASSPLVLAGLVIVVFGAAKGIGQPAFDTALSNVTPPEFRGSAMSLRTSVKNIGGTIGPVALTSASATFTYGTLFAVVGLTTLVFTAFTMLVIGSD